LPAGRLRPTGSKDGVVGGLHGARVVDSSLAAARIGWPRKPWSAGPQAAGSSGFDPRGPIGAECWPAAS
jgi:hypothetical protein